MKGKIRLIIVFWINFKCASQRRAKLHHESKCCIQIFPLGKCLSSGWTSDFICCSTALSKQVVVTSELNWTRYLQCQLLARGLQLLASMSRCCALFSSGLSVYHCVSGSKVWICHCISMPRFKHTHTIILPQSKLSIYIYIYILTKYIYIKYIKKWFYWIFIVLLCFCYFFCSMLTHLPIDILYSLHKD